MRRIHLKAIKSRFCSFMQWPRGFRQELLGGRQVRTPFTAHQQLLCLASRQQPAVPSTQCQ